MNGEIAGSCRKMKEKRQNEEKRMACGWERPEAGRPGKPQKEAA